ncbi:tol-pal system protein YbgF [Thiohalobacter thiocyanaticus]|uniref:Cell division coordinator CpoB n=1 Tax=Thiohalobacter thiocyanaticus TaxID=585455 RepID=A0A426QHH6_9GAMM|nr:tol-pal system protein YbgF [Thiohalobacter thiocyanaticus]RRQ21166.1 tol-pal system protein YbgF [Thiohalobacter thiocyanaticus]
MMRLQPINLILAALLVSAPAVQARDGDLDQRVQRLEQLTQSRGLMEMLSRIEQLQQEVQQLRGDVEVQGHTLEQLRQRQRDLYMDVDRRLQQLESGGGAPSAVVPGAAAAGAADSDRIPVLPSRPATSGDGAEAPDPDAGVGQREQYQQALDILREGRYMQAAEAFRGFLEAHPDSAYAGNAQYWLAESFYVTRQFPQALEEFGEVVEAYPDSNKVADARLKIGFIHYEMEDWEAARRELEAVTRSYPGTTAARLAEERLLRLKREGH